MKRSHRNAPICVNLSLLWVTVADLMVFSDLSGKGFMSTPGAGREIKIINQL